MDFMKHSEFKGLHAFLGASQYSWINYNDEKLKSYYNNYIAKLKGTELHDFAARCIQLCQKLPRSNKTLNLYVNDAIGFKMSPEQVLFYSENCFGTADAISFRDNVLRIHDLKTGATPAHFEQLEIYAALFCLEYKYKPSDIDIILRIYQFDSFQEVIPEPDRIKSICDKIISSDKIINNIKKLNI